VSWGWLVCAAFGLLVVSASVVAARRDGISGAEVRIFEVVNGLPDWLYGFVWMPMQLGNLVVGTAVGLVVAAVERSLATAIGVVLAAVLKLVAEKIVRREMADHLAARQRPGTSQAHARLRGDVPKSGASFPSGHVILVTAISCVVAPHLLVAWWWVAFGLVGVVMIGRVYVGAHNPLDVTAGLGTGLLLGGLVAAFAR